VVIWSDHFKNAALPVRYVAFADGRLVVECLIVSIIVLNNRVLVIWAGKKQLGSCWVAGGLQASCNAELLPNWITNINRYHRVHTWQLCCT
jgi:hypothetical protein